MVVGLLLWVSVILAALAVYRAATRVDAWAGRVFAAGLVARAALGVTLYLASLLEWPLLRSLQTGGGFWSLAIDAQWYFEHAAQAARYGLHEISDTDPSPLYLRTFALFMRFGGISPATAVLFNVLCYVVLSATILVVVRRRAAAVVSLAAFAFAPGLVIFSTQALKEAFTLTTLAIACAGATVWAGSVVRPERIQPAAIAGALGAMVLGVYTLGGVRAYLAVFFIAAVAAAAIPATWAARTGRRRLLAAGVHVVLLLVLWGVFARGAGAYYGYYDSLIRSAVRVPTAPVAGLETARAGFVGAGGATSIAAAEPPLSADAPLATKTSTRLSRVATGLAVMFVPVAILKGLSLVSFSGGRGLLLVTDLDTVAIVLLTCASIYTFLRRSERDIPAAVALCVLAGLTLLCMAYVVTNFGTLFRLRALAFAPLWLLPALATRDDDSLAGRAAYQGTGR